MSNKYTHSAINKKEETKNQKEPDSLYNLDVQLLTSLKPIPGKIISLSNELTPVLNNNNKENNQIMNIKDTYNNIKNDLQSSGSLSNSQQNSQINPGFLLYFTVNENKELYLDTEPTTPFSKILIDLQNKYEWLKNMQIKRLHYNNSFIPLNSNPIQNGLPSEAKIDIIFENL